MRVEFHGGSRAQGLAQSGLQTPTLEPEMRVHEALSALV